MTNSNITTESNWFKDFSCIGGECGYTCCGGWKIGLSQEEIDTYKGFRGTLPDIMSHIDEDGMCMRQKDGHCTLMTEDGWCTLVRNFGDAAISRTCQLFPRSEREYGNVAERHVTISCPAVVRNLFSEKHLSISPIPVLSEADDQNYVALFPVRDYLLRLLEDETKGFAGKVYIILSFGMWAQKSMRDGSLSGNSAKAFIASRDAAAGQLCEEMSTLEKDYGTKTQMMRAFLSLIDKHIDEWVSERKTETFEQYAPDVLNDIKIWKNDSKALQNDLTFFDNRFLSTRRGFVTRYLEQMVYMSFVEKTPEEYDTDFFTRYVELVIIELFLMSRIRHGCSMEMDDICVLVSWLDRMIYYNREARTFLANMVHEINDGTTLELFYFPVY